MTGKLPLSNISNKQRLFTTNLIDETNIQGELIFRTDKIIKLIIKKYSVLILQVFITTGLKLDVKVNTPA